VLGIVCLLWDPSRIERRLFHERRLHFRGGTWDSRFPEHCSDFSGEFRGWIRSSTPFRDSDSYLTRAMDQILPVGNKDA